MYLEAVHWKHNYILLYNNTQSRAFIYLTVMRLVTKHFKWLILLHFGPLDGSPQKYDFSHAFFTCENWLLLHITTQAPWALKPNLLQWGVLGQKLMLNLCRRPRLWLKLLLLTFWKFGLWPCDLLAFGLCDLAEILPLKMGVHKKAAYQISSKSLQKWLSYCSIQVLALAFY